MIYLKTLILGVLFLQIAVTIGAPKLRRWIPERMSDSDYGMDTHAMSSSDGSALNQPNYLTYWSDYFPGGYNGGDYSGMMFRSYDSNPATADPVQQLQHVQAYSYAQALQHQYPYGVPYPPPPPPPQAYSPYQGEAAPTGRALISLGGHSHQQSRPVSSSQPIFVMSNNQRPFFTNTGLQPVFAEQQPQVFVMPQGAIRPQSQIVNLQESPLARIEFMDTTSSNPEATALLVDIMEGNSAVGNKESQSTAQQFSDPLVSLNALNLESTSTKGSGSTSDAIALLNILNSSSKDRFLPQESDPSTSSALRNEAMKAILQAAIRKQQAIQEKQDIQEAEAILDTLADTSTLDNSQDETVVIVEDSQQEHQKSNIQSHGQKTHSTHEKVKVKVTETSDNENQAESISVLDTASHSHSKQHETLDNDKILVKISETEKDISNNADEVLDEIEETEAEGRAHEESVYAPPAYGSNRYTPNPLDLVYPGVMAPVQNRPPAVSSPYYQPPQYGAEQQQYAPQQQTMPGSPYQAYQYQQPSQYSTAYNPYQYQSGSYVPPTVPQYPSQYSSGYYNYPSSSPRVTRNSVAAIPGTVQYVYGGRMYPQFG